MSVDTAEVCSCTAFGDPTWSSEAGARVYSCALCRDPAGAVACGCCTGPWRWFRASCVIRFPRSVASQARYVCAESRRDRYRLRRIFDEPTTSLLMELVARLMQAIFRQRNSAGSVPGDEAITHGVINKSRSSNEVAVLPGFIEVCAWGTYGPLCRPLGYQTWLAVPYAI